MKKKLIEVALPLDAINKASAREKSIRHGHPSTLHLWWARRPLAAARAVIFAQMVDDPSSHPDIFRTEKAQEKERQRLFRIIEDLVLWENTTNEEVIERARAEIWQSWRTACADYADHPRAKELFDRHKLRAFHDPFDGGGSLPREARRWARTVKSPNPAFANVDVPLASTFMLTAKAGMEAYVEPVIEGGRYRFAVKVGKAKDAEAAKNGTKAAGRSANFHCLMSGAPI